jgi:hypothetical protein
MPRPIVFFGLVVIVVFLLVASVSAGRINYKRFATRAVPDGTDYPINREGTVFGNIGGTNIYFAGGVNTLYPTAENFTAFTDIYTYDTVSNKFVKAHKTLPGPSYFGAGGFIQNSLVVFAGRNNTHPVPWTYTADLYVVNFTSSITEPLVSSIALKPAVTARAFHSAALFRNRLYSFGGVTGPDGTTPLNSSELFLSIDIRSGAVTSLPCDANCPAASAVSPAMYLDPSEELIYIYSGMQPGFTSWGSNDHIYIFDILDNKWKTPVSVHYRYNFVFNGLSNTLQAENELLIVGGDSGQGGSVSSSYLFDLMQNPPQVVEIEHGDLSQRCESLTFVGVDAKGNVWAYGGATYASSQDNTAQSYCHGVLTMEYYQDPDKVGAGTKWFAGIAMVLVTAAIVGVLIYLYKKNASRRDYVQLP